MKFFFQVCFMHIILNPHLVAQNFVPCVVKETFLILDFNTIFNTPSTNKKLLVEVVEITRKFGFHCIRFTICFVIHVKSEVIFTGVLYAHDFQPCLFAQKFTLSVIKPSRS